MQEDFHYYATYCAAVLAGFTPEESREICYSAQLVDMCTRTFLSGVRAPLNAVTTQTAMELADARTDPIGLQDITRIWASFHFLPKDLNASVRGTRYYRNKYRLICGPDGALVKKTVDLAKKGGTLQAAGLAMHILADTWAHCYFAGTPSQVINDTNRWFDELIPDGGGYKRRKVRFRHSVSAPDDIENGIYSNSVNHYAENSIMVLGHGRAGHLPDYSFARYVYCPAWAGYREVVKDNPSEYYKAFCQMIFALRCLHGEKKAFLTGVYDTVTAEPYEDDIRRILEKRQLSASKDWCELGIKLSGTAPEPFDISLYGDEYTYAPDSEKDGTRLGRFILAALAQKSMVTNRIFRSGSLLAGFSAEGGGIKDFLQLAAYFGKGEDV